MSVEFRLPDVGEGIREAEIVRWLVQEGERVKEFDPIVEVQTDKAVVELPAPSEGFITEILAPAGSMANVGDVLVVIDEMQNARPVKRTNPSEPAVGRVRKHPMSSGTSVAEASANAQEGAGVTSPRRELTPGVQTLERPKATPAVRHYAREQGVALHEVTGTGQGGRITKEDVDRFIERKRALANAKRVVPVYQEDSDSMFYRTVMRTQAMESTLPNPKVSGHVSEEDDTVRRPLYTGARAPQSERPTRQPTRIPFRGVRRATAEHVKRSAFSAPHVTAFDDCNAAALVDLRNRWNAALENTGQRVSYLPFIIKATVSALKAFPYFNARLNEEAQEIELIPEYHIGIAVDTPEGLFVPVIRDADQLSVREIGEEIYRLSTGAKARTLSKSDLRGSTFTITNMGPIGGLFATPILNYPEVGILAVHQIQRKPIVQGDEVVVGQVLSLSLSFDHRVIDGATSVRFMNHLKRLIENPELLMLELH